jgi:hypothetical protein
MRKGTLVAAIGVLEIERDAGAPAPPVTAIRMGRPRSIPGFARAIMHTPILGLVVGLTGARPVRRTVRK